MDPFLTGGRAVLYNYYQFGAIAMTIPAKLLQRAEKVLPKCRTLCEAEIELGGKFTYGAKPERDEHAAAVTWGLFDGYHGRPEPSSFILGERYLSIYREAMEAGRRLGSKVG